MYVCEDIVCVCVCVCLFVCVSCTNAQTAFSATHIRRSVDVGSMPSSSVYVQCARLLCVLSILL
jgi:hypothetical protein